MKKDKLPQKDRLLEVESYNLALKMLEIDIKTHPLVISNDNASIVRGLDFWKEFFDNRLSI